MELCLLQHRRRRCSILNIREMKTEEVSLIVFHNRNLKLQHLWLAERLSILVITKRLSNRGNGINWVLALKEGKMLLILRLYLSNNQVNSPVVTSISLVLSRGKQKQTSKLRSTGMRLSSTTYKLNREQTWIWCFTTLTAHLRNNNRVVQARTFTKITTTIQELQVWWQLVLLEGNDPTILEGKG
jgi:hypothetical protein